jgi:D-glycero-D-manno-heptose 1,7-bisphosphate phosphatase
MEASGQGAADRLTVGRVMHAAAFLDRDGVLNVDIDFLHRVEDLVWVDGAIAAVRRLNQRFARVIVVTNQSGVARGLYGEADVQRLHAWMAASAAAQGARIDAFYYCPHHPTAGSGPYTVACACRKPEPGMLLRAIEEHAIDAPASLLIGDRTTDLEAARRAGVRGFLFPGGNLDDFVATLLSKE